MLPSQTRRVRTVHLTAPREDLIWRGALLLEDALHTATLPVANNGRLLVVRTLHVGTIRLDQSTATLSLTLERCLSELALLAVHASDPAASTREAVYFRDDIEPFVMLALRLARRQSTTAWFWRLAVPAWNADMSTDDALRTIFFTVTQTQAGLAAAIRLVQELVEHEALDALLTALRPQDGAGLLRAFGWSKPAASTVPTVIPTAPEVLRPVSPLSQAASAAHAVLPAAPAPVVMPTRWRAILGRWLPRWGSTDARTVWLAGMALVAHNPLRLLNPEVMVQAARLLASTLDSRAQGIGFPQVLSEHPPANRVGKSLRRAPTEEKAPVEVPRREAPPHSEAEENGTTWAPHHAPAEIPLGDAPPQPRAYDNGTTPPQRHTTILNDPGYGKQLSTSHPVVSSAEIPGVAPLPSADLTPAIAAPDPTLILEPSALTLTPWMDTPLVTHHAGLFFLIPVLARLGITTFLTPALIEAVFPLHLLRFIGQHLGLPLHDPVRMALATDAAYDPPAHFITPASWQQGIANPGPFILRRVSSAPGKRVLCDVSGRLPLAQWQRQMPETVRVWIRQSGLQRHSHPLHGDVMFRAWLLATRRWLRRQARLGLADVVLRAGRMTATRTHIDVFFHLDQADMRVRRAGLDIDPGWVPWLGRVVYFHYQEHTR